MLYYSNSKKQYIEVEKMNRWHLANAIKKIIKHDAYIKVCNAYGVTPAGKQETDWEEVGKMVDILDQMNKEAEEKGEEVAYIS